MMNNRITPTGTFSLQRAWASIRAHISIIRLASLAKGSRSRLKQGSLLLAVLFTLLALSAQPLPTAQATTPQMDAHWGEMPLYFIANQGQLDSRVAYYVQGRDKTLYFTPAGVTFALTDLTPAPEPTLTKAGRSADPSSLHPEERGEPRDRWIVKLDFVDANSVRPGGQNQTEAVISYFKGSRDEWRTGLPTYSRIVYPDLWEGIDLAYSGTVNRLKYEFVVQPGADPAAIRLAYRGATVQLNDAGQLEVGTSAGTFQDDAPVAYQEVDGERVPVAVSFTLDDGATYGFHLGAYDPTLPLVIDPAVLVYCGYIGGSSTDQGFSIAVDAAGNAYVVGLTLSTEATFPVTVGPDLTYNGDPRDTFVAKVKADGMGLVYAGYIGGSGNDRGRGIAVDSAGNAYVTGFTNSTQATFPVTVGPDLTYNGGDYDVFVAKVKADGTGLAYSGYIGGTGSDELGFGSGIAVDTAGNAYVTGYTDSTQATFPVTVGPDLTYNGGGSDAFVAKVKADGTGLAYAGFIGGSAYEDGYGIAVDSAGNAYVTGYTASTEATFPVTVGPDLTYNGGYHNAFVAKVKANGMGLDYCGYIGGSGWDYAYGIVVDTAGNAYVTGYTTSTEATFPVAVGPDLTFNGDYDAFVAKVKANGMGLDYCGYIGGSGDDSGSGIAVDSAGNAYVVGQTTSTQATFPVTSGPDLTYNGDPRRVRGESEGKRHGVGLLRLHWRQRRRQRLWHCGGLSRERLRHGRYPFDRGDLPRDRGTRPHLQWRCLRRVRGEGFLLDFQFQLVPAADFEVTCGE